MLKCPECAADEFQIEGGVKVKAENGELDFRIAGHSLLFVQSRRGGYGKCCECGWIGRMSAAYLV